MSNTFSNISTQYDSIVKSGNLHDIVISELYDIGEPNYEITNPEWVILTDIKIEDKEKNENTNEEDTKEATISVKDENKETRDVEITQ